MPRRLYYAILVTSVVSFSFVGCSKSSTVPGGSAPAVQKPESPDQGSQTRDALPIQKESSGSGSR